MRISDWSSDVCSSDLLFLAQLRQLDRAEIIAGHAGVAGALAVADENRPHSRLSRSRSGVQPSGNSSPGSGGRSGTLAKMRSRPSNVEPLERRLKNSAAVSPLRGRSIAI